MPHVVRGFYDWGIPSMLNSLAFLMYWIVCKVMVMNIAYKEPLIKIYKYELILVNLISWIFGYIGL